MIVVAITAPVTSFNNCTVTPATPGSVASCMPSTSVSYHTLSPILFNNV